MSYKDGISNKSIAILFMLTIIALVVRLFAATDNFWLDEIFTWQLATEQSHSWLDVFTLETEHHPLVTLTMYLLGDRMNWFWYRLPSVLTGTGIIVLMAWIGYRRRIRPWTLFFVLATAAVSYPFIVYASEARGYAPASFFSLASFLFFDSFWRRGNRLAGLGYWVSTVIAFLYHPGAVSVTISLVFWSLMREGRRDNNWIRAVVVVLRLHVAPIVLIAGIYLGIMRQWDSIGGDVLQLQAVLGDTFSVLLGFPMRPGYRIWSLCLGSILLIGSLMVCVKMNCSDKSEIWIFYYFVLLCAPFLLSLVNGKPYIYVRYFVIQFPFVYLMFGEAVDTVKERYNSLWQKGLMLAFGILVLVGNTVATADFLLTGRGGHRDAVEFMANSATGKQVTVGSDFGFRNGNVIAFYNRYLPTDKRLMYVNEEMWPTEGPDWYIVHNICGNPEEFVLKDKLEKAGKTYRLVKSYPISAGALSGMGWYLYVLPNIRD